MSVGFTASDLVEAAVQLERNGHRFYTAAADSLSSQRAKDLMHRLADDEVEHLKLFERLLTTVGLADVRESYPGEYGVYLKAHVDSQVFTQRRMTQLLAQKAMSERDALQFGIDSEKDAILYYTEMIRFVPSRDHTAVEGIIDEERRHLSQLVGLMKDTRQEASLS
jgi:rubrerythrin